MLDSINRFRKEHGVEPVKYSDNLVNHFCKMHCLAMSRAHNIYHAPSHYLDGWAEAVAMMQYNDHWKDQMIFDIVGASEGHRDILLKYDTIACADYVYDWVIYVTIRGKNRI
jgi:hypothetical protein